MNLLHERWRKVFATKLLEETLPILLHPRPLVGSGKAEVKALARRFANPSKPCAESLHEPGELVQPDGFDPRKPSPQHQF